MAVRVWVGSVRDLEAEAERALSDEDRCRAASLPAPVPRGPFTVSRALQRILGARYLGMPAGQVRFRRDCLLCADPRHGKPRLAVAAELDYSVSHSGMLVGLSASWEGQVGLDIEVEEERADLAGLARHILSAEELPGLRGLAVGDARRAVRRLWTRKEAAVKLTGHGLAVPFRQLTVTGPVARPAPPPRGWPERDVHLTDLPLGEGAVAALATAEPCPEVIARRINSLAELRIGVFI